jgi:2-hydroxychromene-2-carboxylate isomerase
MSLTFWFDVHSPWCYFAATRAGAIARKHGEDLLWRPLHLPRLLDAIGGRKPLEGIPVFVAWFRQDILDFAEFHHLPFRYHPDYPLRNSRALRACQYAAEQGRGEAFANRILRAYWAEAGDITDLDLLAAWGVDAGLDGAGVREAAVSDAYKRKIEENTEAAILRGVFGVPTLDTGSKLYFGNDRLDLLDWHLGQRDQAAARPPADTISSALNKQ